jgi:Lamin Tail Domain/Secretion system C-terminal sorting domain
MKKNLLVFASLAVAYVSSAQNCSDVFISEYVEGTNNNKAIELYNPTNATIDLGAGNYQMGRDRDGAGNPMLMPITGIMPPHSVMVFSLDKRDPNGTGNEIPLDSALINVTDTFLNPVYVQSNSPMYFNGDDAFVLIKGTSTILDIIGKIGEDPGEAWYVPSDPTTRFWTKDQTLIRKSTVTGGITTNPEVFDPSVEWDSLEVNTFTQLGQHFCECGDASVFSTVKTHEFSYFPNPVENGILVIKSAAEMASFRLIAANGQTIASKSFANFTFNANVQLPEAAPGVYFVEVIFQDGTRTVKKLMSK